MNRCALFPVLALYNLFLGSFAYDPERLGQPGNASYDYIVIGGGTAGLAVASRLSEVATVAVIEAGGLYEQDNGNQSIVPYYGLIMPFLGIAEDYPRQTLMDWDLFSTPQASAGNRRIHYAQGKTLGGSSAINTMAYHRGTVGSYRLWADMVDDQSYTFENLLPYFKRSCTLTPPNLQKRNAPNATVFYDPTSFDNSLEGPLQVSWGNWVDPVQSWLARALQAIGQPLSLSGLSSGALESGAWVPTTIDPKDATRSTSKSSYFSSVGGSNISIYLHSRATKILFNDRKEAVAVSVSTDEEEHVLSAAKEVILSAGVFHSPQLLMLSGIGPAATLSAHMIDLVTDLPGVGQNLWDQIFFNILRGVSVPNTGTYLATEAQRDEAVHQYHSNAAGPYSSAGGYLSFEKLPPKFRGGFSNRTASLLSQFPSDWPEIEYIASGFPSGIENLTTIGAISGTLLTPLSRGSVTINSTSAFDPPVIDLGWLSDDADGEVLVAAFKRVREAWNSDAIANITVGPEILPGDAVVTDVDILSYIKQSAQPIWHASSTCAMGRVGDKDAVVDNEAQVIGVKRLRVVDNSITPFSLPGHPQSSVYMLAEKISDDIIGLSQEYGI